MIIKEGCEKTNLSKISHKPKVILDFYANWCAPCKSFAKMVGQVTDHDMLHDVDLIKINVDDHQNLMRDYNVRSLPTIIFTSRNEAGDLEEIFKKIGSMDQTKFLETVVKAYE